MEDFKSKLHEIAHYAIIGDIISVRYMLLNGVDYKEAYLFVEKFHNNENASKLIRRQAICKCGAIAFRWDPDPTCRNCSFHKAIEMIEFE